MKPLLIALAIAIALPAKAQEHKRTVGTAVVVVVVVVVGGIVIYKFKKFCDEHLPVTPKTNDPPASFDGQAPPEYGAWWEFPSTEYCRATRGASQATAVTLDIDLAGDAVKVVAVPVIPAPESFNSEMRAHGLTRNGM